MPELPEVETVCSSLRKVLIGRTIIDVVVVLEKMIHSNSENGQLKQWLLLEQVESVERRGKYIVIVLSNDKQLVIHLRMTGKLLYQPHVAHHVKHTHVIFCLDNGYDLCFHDVRQFGAVYMVEKMNFEQIIGLKQLGIEPLSEVFTPEYLANMIAGKNTKAKSFLLDQRKIAGIGNIYVDEILFQAGIHPEKSIGSLIWPDDVKRLHHGIQDRLQQGILHGGSSIKDYVDTFGQKGTFQEHHKVYGRANMPCVHCGEILMQLKVSGRTTVYCVQCQSK